MAVFFGEYVRGVVGGDDVDRAVPVHIAGRDGTVMDSHEHAPDYIVMVDEQYAFFMADALELLEASPTGTEQLPPKAGDEATPAPAEKAVPARNTTSKPEVLYRHPDMDTLGWTGRGRQPKWVENWIKDGGTLEQLLARKRPAHKPKGGKTTSAACEAATPRCDKTIELPGLAATASQPAA